MPARIVLVVAVAENGVIGHRGGMPWRLPTDLAHFRAVTLGKPVVMGRKTFGAIGRPLPGRDNIVVTRDPTLSIANAHVAHSVEEALALGAELAQARGGDEIAVIGGAEIFAATLGRADRIHLTRVHARPEGDTFFPALDPAEWRETRRETVRAGARDSADMTFSVLERRRRTPRVRQTSRVSPAASARQAASASQVASTSIESASPDPYKPEGGSAPEPRARKD